MTLFDIHAELHTFTNIWSLGFEIGNWYALISLGKWTLEVTLTGDKK